MAWPRKSPRGSKYGSYKDSGSKYHTFGFWDQSPNILHWTLGSLQGRNLEYCGVQATTPEEPHGSCVSSQGARRRAKRNRPIYLDRPMFLYCGPHGPFFGTIIKVHLVVEWSWYACSYLVCFRPLPPAPDLGRALSSPAWDTPQAWASCAKSGFRFFFKVFPRRPFEVWAQGYNNLIQKWRNFDLKSRNCDLTYKLLTLPQACASRLFCCCPSRFARIPRCFVGLQNAVA